MASSRLLRVLRPTCNYRQIYLSRTLPLYTGVFHRHFYSDKPIPVSPAEAEQRHEFPEEELSVPTRPPVKRGRPRKAAQKHESPEEELNVSTDTPVEAPVKLKRGRPRKGARRHEFPEEELNVSTEAPVKRRPPPKKRRPKLTEENGAPVGRQSKRPKLTEEELNESKLNLPPIDKWRNYFAIMEGQRLRFFLRNPDTARKLAEVFVPEGSKDLIVIEAAPGPGQLTRALLNLPKERIKKLIVLEKPEKLIEFLKPLEEVDSRVHVFPWAPKDWHSYTNLSSTGLLDEIQTVDWEKVHPQLRFILHINSTVEGEQLLSQLLRAIPDRHWLFKYGRIPMNLVLSTRMWDRLNGTVSTMRRCKVSVMAQAAAELSEAVPYDDLQPFQDHFHPTVPKHEELTKGGSLDERRTGNPMSAVTVTPLQDQIIASGDLDYWDYCLRRLFVQKATPLDRSISLLGPGAKNLLPKLRDKNLPANVRVDTKKASRDLELHEWALLVRAFKEWPFRPEDLSIDNVLSNNNR